MAQDKEFQELKEWLIMFIKHRDMFHRKLQSISEKDFLVIAEFKDKTHYYAILPRIFDDLNQITSDYKDKHISIITLNTKDNLKQIIKDWDKLSKLQMLSLFFVNPNASAEKKWIIYPFTHNRITEPSSLKLGLTTLFESIEECK
ncbi:hypothetical protein HN695_01830 [Candidatus Woesearchaeota archaeon]|nr:hypothetical protein [Candidatus Woesearchaeota archaeon]MBT5273138.1 hypothetical protein [Candidatus Woesearchaeota archaeon]MBT6041629.1 hypothetical protein [Candidatus Woesearchaeota archaeon]MBT6337547.1 hypothetical protein [Candidatus Woesearchaeota archaeon]MBT7927052.1 hypothetical protein [Candidatus Woesearchaeota archaeon]